MSSRIILLSIFFTIFLVATSLGTIELELNLILWVFVIYISLGAGVLFAKLKFSWIRPSYNQRSINVEWTSALVAGWLGILAFLLRFIDKFVVRDATLSLDFTATLMHLQDAGSTVLGLATAPFIFLCIFPYITLLKNSKKSLFWFCVFWMPAIDALFFGQRFVLLLSMYIFCFAHFIFQRLSIKVYLKIGLIIGFGVSVAAYVINSRYTGYGVDVFHSLQNSAYAEFLILPDFVIKSNSLLLGLLFNIAFYFQHGIYEFQWALATGDYQFTYGMFNFPTIFKVVEYFGVDVDPWSGFSRQGIYLSFFGYAWFDFSFFALFFVFAFGFILKKSELSIHRENGITGVMLFFFLSYVVLMMPVTTAIGYGFGNYFICSLIIYKFLQLLLKIFGKINILKESSLSNPLSPHEH